LAGCVRRAAPSSTRRGTSTAPRPRSSASARSFCRCGAARRRRIASPAMGAPSACRLRWGARGGPRVAGRRPSWDSELLVAVNTDEAQPVTAYSTVAPTFRVEGDQFHLIFWYAPRTTSDRSPDPPPARLTVERKNGPLAVRMTLPPAGFVIYRAAPGLD